jgi:hypothetical protein
MFPAVDVSDSGAVESAVRQVHRSLFPESDASFVGQAFGWTRDCFQGGYADYQPIDLIYHDLGHTLQGTWCMVQLLERRQRAGAQPALSQRVFELGLVAILLHDTGYLKTADDLEGTGAKYTLVHVRRSAEFAARLMTQRGFAPPEIQAVQNMIRCTGVNVDLKAIPFQTEAERVTALALGTADLLGQMAAEDYVDRLPALFEEFAESARYNLGRVGPLGDFSSAEELMRNTPGFWTGYVQPKLRNEFEGLYRFLSDPYPDGPNRYIEAAQANIDQLRRLVG